MSTRIYLLPYLLVRKLFISLVDRTAFAVARHGCVSFFSFRRWKTYQRGRLCSCPHPSDDGRIANEGFDSCRSSLFEFLFYTSSISPSSLPDCKAGSSTGVSVIMAAGVSDAPRGAERSPARSVRGRFAERRDPESLPARFP